MAMPWIEVGLEAVQLQLLADFRAELPAHQTLIGGPVAEDIDPRNILIKPNIGQIAVPAIRIWPDSTEFLKIWDATSSGGQVEARHGMTVQAITGQTPDRAEDLAKILSKYVATVVTILFVKKSTLTDAGNGFVGHVRPGGLVDYITEEDDQANVLMTANIPIAVRMRHINS